MNVQDFCKRLANGRLSNTSLVDSNLSGITIKELHRAKVVDAINEGLIRLYGRFNLKEKEVTLSTHNHITFYRLDPLYSETLYPQAGVEIPYILDEPGEVFFNDVIKVVGVYDHCGCELPLNDVGDCKSVFTPEYNLIQIPEPISGQYVNVLYIAKHPTLYPDHPLDIIELPEVLYGALEAYVAHLLFGDMNTDDSKIRSDKQLIRYEQICGETVISDSIAQSIYTTTYKLSHKGFV